MEPSSFRTGFALSVLTFAFAVRGAAAQSPADGWTTVADAGAHDRVNWVTMDPGWHLSPGPAALIYQPTRTASGTFRIELDAYAFPGEPHGYGVFFGGHGLGTSSFDFFEVLLDAEGRYRLGHQANADYHEVVPWTTHDAIAVPTMAGSGYNELVVEVSPERLTVRVNGVEVTGFEPPAYARFEGSFGIRVLDGANVHVTRLSGSEGPDREDTSPGE